MKTNKNSVRRSLIVSATALVLTVAMLIGTTFAWFTDSVTSGRNHIQAGNLDVELEYKNSTNTDFAPVTNDTKIFSDSEDGTLWEPGHVEYAVLKVKNAGTLALKYNLGVTVVSEQGSTSVEKNPFKLSEYLKVAVLDGDAITDLNDNTVDRDALIAKAETASPKQLSEAGYAAENQELYPTSAGEDKSSEKIVTMVIWMPTDVGNEANYVKTAEPPTIDMGINLVATQYTYEKDSFGSDYDEGATYRVVDAKDIADSINNAKPGDTLKVEGTVTKADIPDTGDADTKGKLVINQPITVEGLTSEVPVAITAAGVTLKGATITSDDDQKPALTVASKVSSVTITDSTFSAVTGKKGNHTAVSIPANGKVVFTGNTVSNNHNGLEFGLGSGENLADGSIISGNTFKDIGNNAISIYCIDDGATITIKDNTFTNVSNSIRLSNPNGTTATFNIENNKIDTKNSWENAIVLLQDYSKREDDEHNFTKFTLNFKGNIFNSESVAYARTCTDNHKDKHNCIDSYGSYNDTNQPIVNEQ